MAKKVNKPTTEDEKEITKDYKVISIFEVQEKSFDELMEEAFMAIQV